MDTKKILLHIWGVCLLTTCLTVIAYGQDWRVAPKTDNMMDYPTLALNQRIIYMSDMGYKIFSISEQGTLSLLTENTGYYALHGASVVTSGNYLIISGGNIGNRRYPCLNIFKIVQILPDGNISQPYFPVHKYFNTPRAYHGSLFINNKVYLFGGFAKSFLHPEDALSSVEYGDFYPRTTTIGDFHYLPSFSHISGAVYSVWTWNSTIYCLGSNPSQTSTYLEKSNLTSDGTITSWTVAGGPYPFAGPAVLSRQSTLFLLERYQGNDHHNIWFANLDPKTGMLRDWIKGPVSLKPHLFPGLVSWDKYIYVLGGKTPKGEKQQHEFCDLDLIETKYK